MTAAGGWRENKARAGRPGILNLKPEICLCSLVGLIFAEIENAATGLNCRAKTLKGKAKVKP
jgi:hypothetical protein